MDRHHFFCVLLPLFTTLIVFTITIMIDVYTLDYVALCICDFVDTRDCRIEIREILSPKDYYFLTSLIIYSLIIRIY